MIKVKGYTSKTIFDDFVARIKKCEEDGIEFTDKMAIRALDDSLSKLHRKHGYSGSIIEKMYERFKSGDKWPEYDFGEPEPTEAKAKMERDTDIDPLGYHTRIEPQGRK